MIPQLSFLIGTYIIIRFVEMIYTWESSPHAKKMTGIASIGIVLAGIFLMNIFMTGSDVAGL